MGAPGISTVRSGAADLGGFRHEVDPGEHDDAGRAGRGQPGQRERVAHVVGDVLDLGRLVVVREDHRVGRWPPAAGSPPPTPPPTLRGARSLGAPVPVIVCPYRREVYPQYKTFLPCIKPSRIDNMPGVPVDESRSSARKGASIPSETPSRGSNRARAPSPAQTMGPSGEPGADGQTSCETAGRSRRCGARGSRTRSWPSSSRSGRAVCTCCSGSGLLLFEDGGRYRRAPRRG